jgi:hypothetical protein
VGRYFLGEAWQRAVQAVSTDFVGVLVSSLAAAWLSSSELMLAV